MLSFINAQHLEERQSQRVKIKVLQNALDVRHNATNVDTVPDHVCDHSKCPDQANLREAHISSL